MVPFDYIRPVDRESTAGWCRPPGIPLGLGMLSGDTWAWYLRSAVVATCVWSRVSATLARTSLIIFFYYRTLRCFFIGPCVYLKVH